MILQDKNNAATGGAYHKKMVAASRSVVEENNGVVTKTFNYDRFTGQDRWLNSYDTLRHWDMRYVEVYEIGPNFIKMKYEPNTVHLIEVIDNKTDHDDNTKLKLLSDYIEMFSSAHSYLAYSSEIFIHNDLSPYNVLVNEKDELIIIDPDSCDYHPRFDRALPDLVSYYTRAMHKYYEVLQHKVRS